MRLTWVFAACLGVAACASAPPSRYVVERDIDGWSYRRYQKTLDVEIPVEGNSAVGHMASYLDHEGPEVMVVTAFVTVYERPKALAATVADRLRTLGSYDTTVEKVEGQWVWRLEGLDDRWWLWVSGPHVIKLGSRDGPVPESLADKYLDIYPSDLNAHGRAREGTPSAGERARGPEDPAGPTPEMPSNLREGTPR